jgi:nucleoside-diphosphate-sugar epimerase
MEKVIVTGANGFIGRHCLKTLKEKGFDVYGIYTKSLPANDSSIQWYQANLLDISQIQTLIAEIKPTHLLHLAWYAVPKKYWQAEENFLWVQSSLELLRQFASNGGQRVVIAGTCAEYDWNYGYCSELITPRKPNTPYGICKQSLQEMVKAYANINNLSSAWGSIFFPYGPHEYHERLVPSVINSLLQGKSALCSHGKQIRDFIYVQDVADAFVALLESNVTGVVNIGSGIPITIKEIVYKITTILDKIELLKLGALATTMNEPPLLVADITRLSNEVGYLPKYNLNQGLECTINWWKSSLL